MHFLVVATLESEYTSLTISYDSSGSGGAKSTSANSDYILLHPAISNFIWFPDIYIGKDPYSVNSLWQCDI